MCVGYRGVFRLPVIGRAGGVPVDRSYLQSVEERAKALRRACRVADAVGGASGDEVAGKQLRIENAIETNTV